VNLLDFIFRLGVVFAIYEFLWGIFQIGFQIIIAKRKQSILEMYFLKTIKYFFLVDVTFLLCFKSIHSDMIILDQVILSGIILLTYFIGKFKKRQNRKILFQFNNKNFNKERENFHLKYEIILIIVSILIFGLFWFYPSISLNNISIWFYNSIINIENTPIFGLIFKVIGFFFLLNLIVKMMTTITFLLNGGKLYHNKNSFNEDKFDDYTEVS